MTYSVMEHFYTIQGEGAFSGQAAYFIRLAGCDVGCVWCDVKESWDSAPYEKFSASQLTNIVDQQSKSNIVIITGGEPAMVDLTELTQALHQKNYRVHIETSGAYELKGIFDWVTLSPKKFKAPLRSALQRAHELKVVVFNKSDFDWAENFEQLVPNSCLLYLQPEWSKREKMQPKIVDYVKENPQWRISLQTHKYLKID